MTTAQSNNGSKGGRPSVRNDELARRIFDNIREGKSLRDLEAAGIIPRTTIQDWLRDDPEFSSQYAIAKAEYADSEFEGMINLADSAIGKPMEIVAATRLAIDTRKWALSKLLPKKFGDKASEVNISTAVHNHLHITEADLRQIQEERQKFLAGEAR